MTDLHELPLRDAVSVDSGSLRASLFRRMEVLEYALFHGILKIQQMLSSMGLDL